MEAVLLQTINHTARRVFDGLIRAQIRLGFRNGVIDANGDRFLASVLLFPVQDSTLSL